jgi:hypothetical protein
MSVATEIRRWARSPGTVLSLKAVIISKAGTLLVGLLALSTIGPVQPGPTLREEFTQLPNRWDAAWYVGVAAGGYRWEEAGHSNSRLAFFPAFPMTLRLAARVLRLPDSPVAWVWTGVLLSSLFFFLACTYLHRLTAALLGDATANGAVIFAVAYPYSLFHGQVYTESLFLLAAVGALYHFRFGSPYIAFCWGLVAGLTRPIGCLVSLPLLWSMVASTQPRRLRSVGAISIAAAALAPCLGTLLYSAYTHWLTGHWLAWLSDQATWGRNVQSPTAIAVSITNVISTTGFVEYLSTRPYEFLNLMAFVAAFIISFVVIRMQGLGSAAFVASGVLAPLLVGGLASMGRYTSVLFPMFIWFGGRKETTQYLLLVFFALLQGLLAALFFTDRPVF